MVKIQLNGAVRSYKKDYKEYVEKALAAFDVLAGEKGAGSDFLGWKHLPSKTPESLIRDCEAVRDDWKAKGVDLVVVIGIGGSYLGARCAVEALSHTFSTQLSVRNDALQVVFAGNNLSEEYLAELMDFVAERNVATVVICPVPPLLAVAFRIVKRGLKNITRMPLNGSWRLPMRKGALKTLAKQEGYEPSSFPTMSEAAFPC